ncbi:hypothetical protein [Actinoplanes sp. GCM10030250]|uniref:hypothetical protein n=1 Tax=Actinoplanes sp. GCM10030250 TaxID=3273376 RepID=UPI003615AA8E
MTTTALMPLDPTVSPQQAARVVAIRANLLPPEIRDGRRARRTRSLVLIMLVLVLAGLGGWYVIATTAKNAAETEYNQTLEQLAVVQNQQKQDDEVQRMIKVKQGNTQLDKELNVLLAKDLSWADLLDLIRDTAVGTKVKVTEIIGGVAVDNKGSAKAEDTSSIGTLQVSGTAGSKKEIAEYVDALGRLTYVSDPFVSNVTEENGIVEYTLTVTITDVGLCGRFTTSCETGGK